MLPKGAGITSFHRNQHVGVIGALAAWRVTQGIYRFAPTAFNALWATPVTCDTPTKVLYHLPEYDACVPSPDPPLVW